MAGQYFDAETGLHYNYHRYYDPSIGRYLTPDPIGLVGGINLYSYARNNPANLIDPYGLINTATWGQVGGGLLITPIPGARVVGGVILIGAAGYVALQTWQYWQESTEEDKCSEERGLGEKWDDFVENPQDWEKIDVKDDPRQPPEGYSRREKWRNKKTGEEIGVHDKSPSGKTRKGKPKHPHVFPPEVF